MRLFHTQFLIRVTCLTLTLLLLILSGYFNLDFEIRQGLSINVCSFGELPLLFLISGLSGTISILILSSFVAINNEKTKSIVLQISNGTIVVLGFHWVIYKLIFSWWLTSYSIYAAVGVALVDLLVFYYIILLANKYCPALLGNRKLNNNGYR